MCFTALLVLLLHRNAIERQPHLMKTAAHLKKGADLKKQYRVGGKQPGSKKSSKKSSKASTGNNSGEDTSPHTGAKRKTKGKGKQV